MLWGHRKQPTTGFCAPLLPGTLSSPPRWGLPQPWPLPVWLLAQLHPRFPTRVVSPPSPTSFWSIYWKHVCLEGRVNPFFTQSSLPFSQEACSWNRILLQINKTLLKLGSESEVAALLGSTLSPVWSSSAPEDCCWSLGSLVKPEVLRGSPRPCLCNEVPLQWFPLASVVSAIPTSATTFSDTVNSGFKVRLPLPLGKNQGNNICQ